MTFHAKRRQLTEKEEKWLKAHFKNTKNDDIMVRLGITHSHLHTLARELGLKKTSQFMRKSQANCTAKAKEAHMRIKREEPERWEKLQEIRRNNLHWDDPNKKYNFKKGESNKDRLGKRRYKKLVEKVTATMRQKRERDRVRVAMGLEPLTRLALGIPSKRRHALYQAKWHLEKRYGYERGEGLTMYVTEDTRRTSAEELYIRRYGMKFVVKRATVRDDIKRDVKLPPDWSDRQGGFNYG